MSEPAERKRAVSWAFDGVVMVTGLAIALAALVGVPATGRLDTEFLLMLAFGAPVIAVMSRFPLVLTRGTGGLEVGFESSILVFMACRLSPVEALAVWVVGEALTQVPNTKRVDVRIFNIGLGAAAGWAALATMTARSPLERTEPSELAAVGVGCAVYFAVDYVLSAVSLALEENIPLLGGFRQGSALAAMGVFVAIDSLGYLAAVVARGLPAWTSALLAVPLVTILVATRALARGTEHRRRLGALFEAAAAAQMVQSNDELERLLRTHARKAVITEVELRPEAPTAKELGARVRAGSRTLWLVSPIVKRARASIAADKRALETLATVGEEAFARLRLVGEMGHLARHDSLTGLPNRMLFLDRVEQAVARAHRHDVPLAVLFLDLDGFKAVNDRFGHAEGDELLKTVAARLVGCVRAVDSVARLGGDEFAVLLEEVEETGEVELLCRRILAALRREISIADHDVLVGASIGVAMSGGNEDAAGLLRNADMAMYRAKALGKDRYFLYQPSLREANIKKLELIEALRRGVADELVVYYQPVVELATGRIDGLEALVRWNHGGQLVQPDMFISVAEECGLIIEIGERVLAQAVEDCAMLVAAAGRGLYIGVNMSALQLRDRAFVEQVGDAVVALAEHESTLLLEMTESIVVADDHDTADVLHTLKALGALLAIDDFGVGFSSIGYLQHLPVDVVKIDRSFTRDMDSSPRAAALVEAILVMGRALGVGVIAEGIERQSQADQLQLAGCHTGQGYFYGRPAPLSEVTYLLSSHAGAMRPAATL